MQIFCDFILLACSLWLLYFYRKLKADNAERQRVIHQSMKDIEELWNREVK